jgi:hypothetical protein
MTLRCTCLDASIRRTCCYNVHHYAAHTCRRLTLFCAGTANSLLCTPATTWPPRQLLALLPHVSMFHLNNPYNFRIRCIPHSFMLISGRRCFMVPEQVWCICVCAHARMPKSLFRFRERSLPQLKLHTPVLVSSKI